MWFQNLLTDKRKDIYHERAAQALAPREHEKVKKQITNYKHQIPNKFQIPISKSQTFMLDSLDSRRLGSWLKHMAFQILIIFV